MFDLGFIIHDEENYEDNENYKRYNKDGCNVIYEYDMNSVEDEDSKKRLLGTQFCVFCKPFGNLGDWWDKW